MHTTKNIFILVAAIHAIKVVILTLVLLVMFVLLITMNSDLEDERATTVTPVIKWITHISTSILSGHACSEGPGASRSRKDRTISSVIYGTSPIVVS